MKVFCSSERLPQIADSEKVLRECDLLHSGTVSERIALIIERSGIAGIELLELVIRTGIHQNRLKEILKELSSAKKIVIVDGDESRCIFSPVYENLQRQILQDVQAFHERYPLREGILKEELRNATGQYVSPKLFNMALKDLERKGTIVIERENLRMPGHRVDLKGDLDDLRNRMENIYFVSGLTPPTLKEVMEKFADRKNQLESVLNVMLKEGTLTKINEDLYFHKEILLKLRENYKNLLLREGKATPASFKELTGLTRKFIIPLMEYFDITKLTIRAGDHRILREK